MYDVAIIGGGVIGCAIAREFSRFDISVVLVERESDVAMGSSKANSGIVHAGYDCVTGTLMARLNVQGSRLMEPLCRELSVPYERIGSLVLAFEDHDLDILNALIQQGEANNVKELQLLSPQETLELEPSLNPGIKGALYAPTAAICCPYELTTALAENAVKNGVDIQLSWEAVSIHRDTNHFLLTDRQGRRIMSRYLINAAGLYADAVSGMAGAESYRIIPRKGEYILLDKRSDCPVSTVLFQPPSKMGKGVLVSPTVDGNLFAGPTAIDQEDKEDDSTTTEGLTYIRESARRSVPDINIYNTITQFAGIRSVLDGKKDFKIEASKIVDNLIHVAGICSPGLSSAPAIAVYVREILEGCGQPLVEKTDFDPIRQKPKPFRDMDDHERRVAIKENPLYGRVICRCETITEAEIIAAIHAEVPALTLDAVKRRTRGGMGRCQGGFCGPRIMDILCRETGMDRLALTKFGGRSWIVSDEIKVSCKEGHNDEG